MRVVSNTSPLIALAKLERLDLLQQLFQKITIPESVYHEFLDYCPKNEEENFRHACDNFIEIIKVQNKLEFNRRLDLGEQEVLSLALNLNADIALIDDKKAVNEAKDKNIKIASTRAILIIAEEKGLIKNYQLLINQLKLKSFFVPNY